MKTLFLKDMRYRQARVVLTALGITVLISLILLLGGIMNGMRIQARQYVERAPPMQMSGSPLKAPVAHLLGFPWSLRNTWHS